MFNNYNLSDEDVLGIIDQYENLIDKYSRSSNTGKIDEQLKTDIIGKIYMVLTHNRER